MRSSAIQGVHRGQKSSLPTRRWPNRNWGPFASNLPLVSIPHPTRMPDGPTKRPSKYLCWRAKIYLLIDSIVLGMTLNYIQWWGSSFGCLRNMEFLFIAIISSPLWPGVIWLCRLGQLNTPTSSLQRGKTPPENVQDLTQNNLMVILELWGMQNTPLLPLLTGPLWLGVVAPDRLLSIDQIELNCVETDLIHQFITACFMTKRSTYSLNVLNSS